MSGLRFFVREGATDSERALGFAEKDERTEDRKFAVARRRLKDWMKGRLIGSVKLVHKIEG